MTVSALILSFVAGLGLVPLVRHWSVKSGRVYLPREDRWHKRPTATLGGIALYLACMLGIAASFSIQKVTAQHIGLIIGVTLAFALGLIDDYKRLTPPVKLVAQILIAGVVISFGYRTEFFTPRVPNAFLAEFLNIFLTLVWLVGITNAINLLDNMDGLAAGIAFIAAIILAYFFWTNADFSLMIITMALAGSLLAFLFFNFPPASIFMGDSGSQFIGLFLAILAIAKQPQASDLFAVIGVPTIIFMLPIFDTAFVAITRFLRGQSPAQGGKDHTSHRLIAFGFSERQTVIFLYLVALASGVFGILIESIGYWLSLVLVPFIVIVLALFTAYLSGIKVTPEAVDDVKRSGVRRFVFDLAYRRRIFEVVLDFLIISLALYLSFLINKGYVIGSSGMDRFEQALPLVLAVTYLSYFLFGVYRGLWRYLTMNDIFRYIAAVVCSAGFSLVAVYLVYGTQGYPITLFILYGMILFFGLLATRSSFRLLDLLARSRERHEADQRVILIGERSLREIALQWISNNSGFPYKVVGVLEQNPYLAGRVMDGIEVLGSTYQLDNILQKKKIDGVIEVIPVTSPDDQAALNESRNTAPSVEGWRSEDVRAICQKNQCWYRLLKLEFELIEQE